MVAILCYFVVPVNRQAGQGGTHLAILLKTPLRDFGKAACWGSSPIPTEHTINCEVTPLSRYHFHRLFSMITGMTITEYIRNRRLSLVGQELVLSEEKVIDIALKYGYDSPESFSKAFSRFHSIAPSAARRSGM
ncbi:MAG: helix-turn-helix transcriptional regulator [Anaerolineaceae bacterium]|nr:helix-turn-helix transcriptional regulator [Anaerolineaceae bacterium]